jgi:ABC-type polysaccharide/polyol phosphate transport system ATPase subunit
LPEIALACSQVWKSYRIYQHRSHTLKEKVLTRRNAYEVFWALKSIDLEVPVGTTLGIIGHNGSGKSTLLKTFARILTPDRGSVELNGTLSSLLELGIGFHPELTGRENVFLGGSLLGQSRRQVEARYDEIVEFAGIEQFMDMPVKNYSSGMYARLAFAVAVSVDPDILLIDEVLSVGDERFQIKCYERIAEFRAQGRTIVLVSHSLDAIRAQCSTAVWLENGEVREAGKATEVVGDYLREAHTAVARQLESSAHRLGSGDAEIMEVTFLDGDGKESASFRTGDPMTIRLRYRSRPGVREASCGVAVYRADNQAYVFGQNSKAAGVDIPLGGSGMIEFTLPELPLLQGRYEISVALHDDDATTIYDHFDRAHSFSVYHNPAMPGEAGTVHVSSIWKTSASPVGV